MTVFICGDVEAYPALTWGDDFPVARIDSRAGYITRLVDAHARMVIVCVGEQSPDDDWRFWTATVKSSPATRRVPVVCVSDSTQVRALSLISGADFTLPAQDALRELPRLLEMFGRGLPAEALTQLACDCALPLPESAREAIALFNAGEYYRQHDLLEALWMQTDSPVRDLYRAILQVGIGYYQITRGNYRGALKMFLRSVQWLNALPDVCQGVNVAALRADSYRVRAELERLGEGRLHEFDRTLIAPVKWA